jgi:FKBP-type peptidyl-prolyl cis-trans isomerase 2
MFDGNVAENLEPLALVVGNGNVLEGLEIGLLGMRVNGMRRLVVPPSLVS